MDWTDYSPPSPLTPCLVVNLILEGMDFGLHWDTGLSLFESLSACLGTTVEYIPFTFNVVKGKKSLSAKGDKAFAKRLVQVVKDFEDRQVRFFSFLSMTERASRCRIIVVLSTHSMADTGHPQERPEGDGLPIDDVSHSSLHLYPLTFLL
jgi:hypothetical protein